MAKKRSFTLLKDSDEKGRYMSANPSGAARKAFSQLCRSDKKTGECTMEIELRETTQDSKKKVYKYRVSRKKLEEPLKIDRGGKSITVSYETKVKSMRKM